MAFRIAWDDDAKTVIRYVAEGNWSWKDLHGHVRLSTFALDRLDHPVESILDLSQSARMPAGAVGHLRSLGKQDHPNRRPRIIVIGVDREIQQQLGAVDGIYQTREQLIHFVNNDAEAQAVLTAWRRQDASQPGP